jgi:hypothetical protein
MVKEDEIMYLMSKHKFQSLHEFYSNIKRMRLSFNKLSSNIIVTSHYKQLVIYQKPSIKETIINGKEKMA